MGKDMSTAVDAQNSSARGSATSSDLLQRQQVYIHDLFLEHPRPGGTTKGRGGLGRVRKSKKCNHEAARIVVTAVVVLVAGYDTMANAMSFMYYPEP